jgi:hypothetical protein
MTDKKNKSVSELSQNAYKAKVRAPLALPAQHDVVKVDTHRQLLLMARTLSARLKSDPEFSVMLLANPVLALKKYGIDLSTEMQRHVLHTLRHPKKLRDRRAELEKALEAELGEAAKPNDSKWLAKLVFVTRDLSPRKIGSAVPTYKPAFNAQMIERQQRLRRPATNRYKGVRRSNVQASVAVSTATSSIRSMDLNAAVPKLPAASRTPKTLSLEEAWFYKDDPIVHNALELGQIERRAFPFKTPAEFRDLVAGKKVDAFRAFVTSVRVADKEA